MRIETGLIGSMPIILFGGYDETSHGISYKNIELLAYKTAKCLLENSNKINLTCQYLKEIRCMLNIDINLFSEKMDIPIKDINSLENNNDENIISKKEYINTILSLSGFQCSIPDVQYYNIEDCNIVAYYNLNNEWEVYIIPKIKLPLHTLISEYCLQEKDSSLGLNRITINRRQQKDKTFLWAVLSNGSAMDKNGDISGNSFPSSMTEEEIEFTRFKDIKDASIAALLLISIDRKNHNKFYKKSTNTPGN